MASWRGAVKSNAGRLRAGMMDVWCDPVEEAWDQIGKRLRGAREKAGLSVDDVVHHARIPRSVVEALEAEDFSVFTSPTYAKSFLRQYSGYLEVDAEPWLDALVPASFVSGESWQPMFAETPAPPAAVKRQARDPRRQEPEPIDGSGKWSALWVMLLTGGLVFAVVKGYKTFEAKFGAEDASKDPPVAEAQPPAAPKTPAAPSPPAPPATAGLPSESANTSGDPSKDEPPAHPIPRAVIVRE